MFVLILIILALLCATSQRNYCCHEGVLPSVSPYNSSPRESSKDFTPNFGEKLHNIPRPWFLLFQNFVNMTLYGRKKSVKISPESRFTANISYILMGSVSTKVVQRFVKFELLFLYDFFSLSLTWDHKRVNFLNVISPEVQAIFTTENPCILVGWVSTKII